VNSQQFLFINFIIFLALVLFFLFGRSKTKPSLQLNLKESVKDGPKEGATDSAEEKNEIQQINLAKDVSPRQETAITERQKNHQKNSNFGIYFVYNGHEWEAYEVLGLPKDSTLQITTSHYQNLIKTSDPSTFEFYEAAHLAILKTISRHKH